MSTPEQQILETIIAADVSEDFREEMANKRFPMNEGEILHAVDQEIRWSTDLLQDEIGSNRTRAWQYFQGTAPKTLDEDISEYFQGVVTRDVADAIEATLAEILPAFASDRPAEFDPIGPGDEHQAAMESDVCNDILMEAGSGYLEFTTAAKNSLLLRIGAIEIIWEDYDEVEYQEATVDPDALALLMQNPDIDVREIESSAVVDMQTGIQAEQINVELRIRHRVQKIRPEAVPVDELLISSDSTSLDLERARFVARQTLCSRSDLIARGYDRDIVESLTAYTTTTSQRSRSARERNTWGREKHTGDHGMDLVQCVRCYYRLDEDRDGIAERRQIIVAGTPGGWRLLSDEPIDYQPFAAGAAYIWPHMPHGVSLYDKLGWIQDVRTKFTRIMLEAGQRAARDRVGILPGTDIDDWMNTQFGGAVRMSSQNGIFPIPSQQFPTALGQLDQMMQQARREGGGGAVDKSNREAMPVEAGAHGVERMLAAIEELNSAVARMLAETLVKQSYLIIHKVLRLYSPVMTRKIAGEWQQIDPKQWQPRDKISLATGLTLSERGRLAGALGMIVQKQSELIEKGSTLADQGRLYRSMVDQARMLGLANPESYYLDPQSEEGMQAAQQQQMQQQASQQEARQAQAQQAQMQTQMMLMIEQARGQMRLQAEREKGQADMVQAIAKMQEDQRQFQEQLALSYDQLRVKLAEIEAKYGEQDTAEIVEVGSGAQSE